MNHHTSKCNSFYVYKHTCIFCCLCFVKSSRGGFFLECPALFCGLLLRYRKAKRPLPSERSGVSAKSFYSLLKRGVAFRRNAVKGPCSFEPWVSVNKMHWIFCCMHFPCRWAQRVFECSVFSVEKTNGVSAAVSKLLAPRSQQHQGWWKIQ